MSAMAGPAAGATPVRYLGFWARFVAFIVDSIIVGFLIAAPVGPINVLCVRRTIVHGRLVGLVSGLGAAAADTFFGAIAAFVLGVVLWAFGKHGPAPEDPVAEYLDEMEGKR